MTKASVPGRRAKITARFSIPDGGTAEIRASMWSSALLRIRARVAGEHGTLTVTKGTPKSYTSTGDSGGKVTRMFCGDCGSPLFSEPDVGPFQVVKAASMDNPGKLTVGGALYVSEAQPWAHIDPAKPAFEKMPPGAR